MTSSSSPSPSRLPNPALFICDIQEKFRSAIHEFPLVISTASKMLRAAKFLSIPVYVTTQNAAKLGDTVKELQEVIPEGEWGIKIATFADKTAFSMMVPEIRDKVERQASGQQGQQLQVIIVGIETHICVTQTTLDLLAMGHKVYVLQDGVSSCNAGERGVALRRLQAEGAVVTTSESILFELVGDAGGEEFKLLTKLVKETKGETARAVEGLCEGKGEGGGSGSGSKL
jgi:nicotinamidase-related amidase